MLSGHHDPILALATAPGRGAVGIVRVSGRSLGGFVQRLLGRSLRPREATYLPFSAADGTALDQGLALFFPAPHSFTGEDVLELQGHGGPLVMQLLLARCLEVAALVDPATGQPVLDRLRLAQADAQIGVQQFVDTGGVPAPVVSAGKLEFNGNYTLLDDFSQHSGGPVTVFARRGSECGLRERVKQRSGVRRRDWAERYSPPSPLRARTRRADRLPRTRLRAAPLQFEETRGRGGRHRGALACAHTNVV